MGKLYHISLSFGKRNMFDLDLLGSCGVRKARRSRHYAWVLENSFGFGDIPLLYFV